MILNFFFVISGLFHSYIRDRPNVLFKISAETESRPKARFRPKFKLLPKGSDNLLVETEAETEKLPPALAGSPKCKSYINCIDKMF